MVSDSALGGGSSSSNSGLAKIVEGNRGYGGGLASMKARNGGKLLWEGAWGPLAHESREAMAPSTPFEIASIAKMFTATATLLLIGSGRLASLTQPLASAAPRLILGGDGGGSSPLPPQWHNVTLQQLLQHTSGLQDYWESPEFRRAFDADAQRLWTPWDILEYAARLPSLLPRPHSYHYSDTNYIVAGLVVEEASGMSLGDYFERAIFQPLGMNSTYFNHLEPYRGPIAHRYEGEEDLTVKRRQSADWAGGGLVSTTADLHRFLLEGLVEGRLGGGPHILDQMKSQPVPTDIEDVEYGLGLFLVDAEDELGQGSRVWGHEGWGHSFLWYDEQAQVAAAGTVNQQDARADPYDAVMAVMAAGRRMLAAAMED